MNCRNLHNDINPVQQRSGNPAAVVLYRPAAAGTPAGRVAVPSAFAGVHGTDHHKFSGISHGAGRPGNSDPSVFKWLTHQVKGILSEFRQFVQKQNALMSHGYLTRSGVGAAANQAGI